MTTKRGLKALLAFFIAVSTAFASRHGWEDADRRAVLEAPSERLQKWGRHFVVGYDRFEEIEALVSRGAVGGVFLRSKNVRGKTLGEIAAQIVRLQDIQKGLGLPPLLIAADQEGGLISRMSPPLPYLPSLSRIIREAQADEIERTAASYATLQARQLSRMGVNLNFAPVIDLQGSEPLTERAIDADPQVVERAAMAYALTLEKFGIAATLKHFPGLGRFAEDTHVQEAVWEGPIEELEIRDWVPFQGVSKRSRCLIMLGHVRLKRLDPDSPVSLSKKVVQGVLRGKWNREDLLLITDDFQMQPIRGRAGGVGEASIQALNAGVDLILTANDLTFYYQGMRALLAAEEGGRMDEVLIGRSERRLERFQKDVIDDGL